MIHNLQKSAKETHFDKNISGMNADNVQGAIDELKGTKANAKDLTYTKLVEASSTYTNKPWLVLKNRWAEIPVGMSCIHINCASAYGVLVYKLNDNYGKAYIFNYGGTVDYIARKTTNGWSYGSTSVTGFTDF
jgi:hypothetical protein